MALAYGWVAFAHFPAQAFYSGDMGPKYVQARSFLSEGFSSLTLPYPGALLDPTEQFFPFAEPFVFRTAHGIQASSSPTSALVRAAFGDIRGVTMLALLGAIVVLWLATRMAVDDEPRILSWVLGFGTCLWFYAVIPWEHAPAAALGMAGVWIGLNRQGWRWAVVAGLLIGLGTAILEEVVLLLPGLLVASWASRRGLAGLAALLAGTGLVVATSLAGEVLLYGRPAGAHAIENSLELSNSLTSAFAQLGWRYDIVVRQWLMGSLHEWFAPGLMLAAVAAISAWRGRRSVAVPILAGAAALGSIGGLASQLQQARFATDLFHLSPFLIFAVLPAPFLTERSRLTRRTVLVTAAGFLGLSLMTAIPSGRSLGPRFLMPVLPLLTVAAWQGILAYWRTRSHCGLHWLTGALGLILLGTSGLLHLGVMLPTLGERLTQNQKAIDGLRQASEQVVIVDEHVNAQLLAPLYFQKTFMLARTQPQAHDLASRLAHAKVPRILLVTREERGRVTLAPYRWGARELKGRFRIERWYHPELSDGLLAGRRRTE